MVIQYSKELLEDARILPLVQEPNDMLHQRSAIVPEVSDETRQIMHDMLLTMYHHRGIGLTAVQVGIMQKIIVIDIDRQEVPARYAEKAADSLMHDGPPLFMVNAEIVAHSDSQQEIDEGCLSVRYVSAKVTRPSIVKVSYLDYHGREQQREFGPGLLSSCIQHEIDHSNGILYWDRIGMIPRQKAQQKMYRLIKKRGK